ncbi:HAD family hydrolase [Nocardioides endophyticus]|uniref:HAD family hydrolase n=1 Tax=Nocardioides endophyticus TaxID=1353775 RepID=A0ABP8Z0J9_9ACTN
MTPRGAARSGAEGAAAWTPRAVVLDFDGLLVDTESTLFESWRYEWEQWGLDLPVEGFFAPHGGDVTHQRMRRLAGAVGDHFDEELSRRRRLEYRDGLHQDLDLRQGIRDWIGEAAERGVALAVASSSPTSWLEEHLGRVGVLDGFDVLAGGDEVGAHKPDPAVYRLALHRLGAAPDDVVAVEDTPHGVAAAHGAGLACIAIPNPYVGARQVEHAELVLTSATSMSLVSAAATAHVRVVERGTEQSRWRGTRPSAAASPRPR